MTVYQFYMPQPVLFDLAGIGPIPNGKVYFYELGTSTPADTWSDYGKGDPALNSNPVLLDASGRPSTEIWLDGAYTVRVDDGDGVTVNTFDMRPAADDAASIPIPQDNEYLGGDGVGYIAKTYRGLPDPTGLIGYFPVSDGEGYVMTPTPDAPVIPDPEIVITTTPNRSFRAGVSDDESKFYMQCGIATAPATGQLSSSVTVTFPEPFDELWTVIPTILVAGVSSLTPPGLPSWGVTGFTPGAASTDVTVNFRIATDAGSGTSNNINNPVPFAWVAIGIKTVAVTP